MLLKDFFDYKTELMKTFCSNEEIVSLLTDDPNAPVPNKSLAYTQIFPYEFVPETIGEADTYICFDVDVVDVPSKTFLVPALFIYVFTHKSKLRLDDGRGVRTDYIASLIDQELNGSRLFGLGQLELSTCERFSPVLDYQGRVLIYYATEFNRTAYNRKSAPANRKQR